VGCDGHISIPFPVQSVGQLLHVAKRLSVQIDKGQVTAAQTRVVEQTGQGVQSEYGTPGSNYDHFRRKHDEDSSLVSLF
jgi:hypothetical protein